MFEDAVSRVRVGGPLGPSQDRPLGLGYLDNCSLITIIALQTRS